MKKEVFFSLIIPFVFWVYLIGSWVVNVVKFCKSDFDAPFKEEIIHGLGIILPPISMITCWF